MESDVNGDEAIEDEIRRLIQHTTNAESKAFLMVAWKIVTLLNRNTELTEENARGRVEDRKAFDKHVESFNDHLTEERELFAQGRGLYRAMAVSLGVVSVLVSAMVGMAIYILMGHVAINEKQETRIQMNSDRLTGIEARINVIERDHNRFLPGFQNNGNGGSGAEK